MSRAGGTAASRPLRVVLLQLPVPNNPALNVPLAAGYLKAYAAAQGLLEHVAIEILPRALTDYAGDALLVEAIVARQPQVLGLSLYTWNSERSLALAERVKQRLPALRVVVGGPEVQRDNAWVLWHPAVDVAVLGEGEQTFAELLRLWSAADPTSAAAGAALETIAGLAYRVGQELRFTAERSALDDLRAIPSPYLLGYLEVPPDSMLLIEVSRWCPYRCSFCLYGRNLGSRLGRRYFDLQRLLDEIRWARARGVRRVHFVEANLNLVPLFWPLMEALAELNADRAMTFYAELRAEHLSDAHVAALDRANVRYVEVGLQSANPTALRVAQRPTNLQKWTAGVRRLYERQIEVYLDVILGLPADDEAGVRETIRFITREGFGPYDVFTLQALPGTAVRRQAADYGLHFQARPPYYVLSTDRFSFATLRALRRELKTTAGLDPDAVEGMPVPRQTALSAALPAFRDMPVMHVRCMDAAACDALAEYAPRLAAHVDLVLPAAWLERVTPALATWLTHNPTTLIDLYLLVDDAYPTPEELRRWRDQLPFVPGYLDRVAVFRNPAPAPAYQRVSPRVWLVLPWTAQVDPSAYADCAAIVWRFDLEHDSALPLGAWTAAGGSGIWLHLPSTLTPDARAALLAEARAWAADTGRMLWPADPGDMMRWPTSSGEHHLTDAGIGV